MAKNTTSSSSSSSSSSNTKNKNNDDNDENNNSSSNKKKSKNDKNDDNDNFDEDEDETPLQRAQRRELRKEQRKLLDSVQDNFEKLTDKNANTFDDIRLENNRLFNLTKKTREQHNDALILQQLSKGLKKMTASTSNLSSRYNFLGFKDKLLEQYEDKELNDRTKAINWVTLGEDVGSFMRTPGNITTFLGPLLREEKVRKEIQRTKKRDAEVAELRPEELIHDEDDINEATNERFQILEENNDVEINNLIKILVDPLNSVQTIENFFDFSFMIKNKKARIFEHKSCTGLLGAVLDDDVGDEKTEEKNQAVLAMNMKHLGQLQELMKTAYPSHRCPLHRDDELYSALDANDQADILEKRANSKKRKVKSDTTQAAASSSSSSSSKKRTS